MKTAVIAHPFGTPLVWRGWRSLPAGQLLAGLYFTWQAGRRRPGRSLAGNLAVGFASMGVFLGSEWLHNLCHAAAARAAGKPMDSLEVLAGMPVCIYSVENHRSTRPRQHILRALGGPAVNLAAMLLARVLRGFTTAQSPAREVLDVAVAMNTFLATASLLPLPGIDGGPILKWSLVESGRSPAQADALGRKIDLAFSPLLAGLAGLHFRRKRWWSGGLAAFFAAVALAVGLGWMRGETRDT